MTNIFEPGGSGRRGLFEPFDVRRQFEGIINDERRVEFILRNRYPGGQLQRELEQEEARMDEQTKRRLRLSGPAAFAKSVMKRVAARVIGDRLVHQFGPAVATAFGLGGTVAAGSVLSNLSPEAQDIYAPFLERMTSYGGADAATLAGGVDMLPGGDAISAGASGLEGADGGGEIIESVFEFLGGLFC